MQRVKIDIWINNLHSMMMSVAVFEGERKFEGLLWSSLHFNPVASICNQLVAWNSLSPVTHHMIICSVVLLAVKPLPAKLQSQSALHSLHNQSILHNASLLCLVHCCPNKVAHIAESGGLHPSSVTDLGSDWFVPPEGGASKPSLARNLG